MNLIVSLTICFVLVTVGWILALLPTVSEHRARFLFGIIGFASVFLGLRVLGETGMLTLPVSDVNVALADLVVAALYLASLLFLRSETTSHQIARVQLRLSQAAEPPVAQLDKGAVSRILAGMQEGEADQSGSTSPGAVEERMLGRLIQASPVAIIGLDETGKVCLSNRAAQDLFRRSAAQLHGKPLPTLKVPGKGRGKPSEPNKNKKKTSRPPAGADATQPEAV